MSNRIGVVVGGGDCPGLNAVIRSVAKAAAQRDWETIGIIGGYDGLLRFLDRPSRARLTLKALRFMQRLGW